MNQLHLAASQEELEVLAFRLGVEEYCVAIQCVQEIRGYSTCTQIASTADFVRGVLNLRGVIVPVIDLRLRLGVGAPVYDQFTVIIVVNVGGRTTGVVVDRVSDVVVLGAADLRPTPAVGHDETSRHLLGVGMHAERLLQLLDIDWVTQYDSFAAAPLAA